LADRLEDSHSVRSPETPPDLVTMNSIVELRDLHSGAGQRVRLVYPSDYDLAPNCVSILDPLGTQLLGSLVGDVVDRENRPVRVAKIVSQPEQMGAWHL
jgi:regulator of nucleoside diphosphate kinase